MLIRRSELRLALTAGLMNGFGALAPLAYGFYAPLAVLVVCTGTYGGSIGLGRQRLLGSVAGALVLVVSFTGLSHLPLPLRTRRESRAAATPRRRLTAALAVRAAAYCLR
jgi:uncharacterized membrane protein YccC